METDNPSPARLMLIPKSNLSFTQYTDRLARIRYPPHSIPPQLRIRTSPTFLANKA